MINELRTFIAVCRHGTFAAAGERIGLTQSAVSSQVKRLEEALGFALFERTGRSATLNAAGQTTLARAEEICALYARLGELPDDAASGGLLRIGAIASAQSTLVARALARLRKQQPLLRVHVSPGVSMRLMDELDAGTIDAAVIIRPPFGLLPELAWQPLVQEPYVLIAPRKLPGKDWRALLQEQPFLRYDRASFGGRMVERFLRREGIAVNDSIELDEIAGLVHMTSKGLGVALVPLVEAHLPLPAGVRMLPLGEFTFHREVGLLQRKPRASPPAAAQFAQCLREAAQ
ncbi:DNA-binding transcriptional LysR family regulator [Variovorax paradoxus]|uniref:LysR family transcriptional regulator n=1 Tax=Variovorax paradoxus TaxID=34073 RepID=UPI001AE67C49|nr:LysR family transcriptional regulator [Variovorax paradoxus]MDP9965800.1 DNA-binding transcriptional LysR family regulator [Variovorax paradoxus]MDR6452919.1 DNA-binding transcriptional LysR family regulator [Variovorax paradoxus]